MGIKRDPLAVADIKDRREVGETLASIGKSYGVSREYIRQICNAYSIKDKTPPNHELAQKALDLLKTGKAASVLEAAQLLGVTYSKISNGAKNSKVDFQSAVLEQRSHKHDGKRFGMWQVLPGSYRRELKEGNSQTTPLVDCRCGCGTKRTVSLHNLQNCISRGCGCRSKTGAMTTRMNVPWRCLQTRERQINTASLAKRFGVNVTNLLRKLNRQADWTAPDRTTWIPLLQEASVYNPAGNGQAWTCLDSGKTWPSATALAKDLVISNQSLSNCKRDGRTYCGADKRHYVPVGMEDLTRSKFVPRVGSRAPKAAK